MPELFDCQSSSAHLLEDSDRELAENSPGTAPPTRRRFRPRVGPRPGKPISISLALVAVFVILHIIFEWRIFWRSEHKGLSSELTHRSACSTYPEACQNTAPFVFDSVYTLLKQPPSSHAPNGHSVVFATVAPDTSLYHAQNSNEELQNPVVLSFDAEMSPGIHGSTGTSTLHTMTTTKELRVIYFDGHSATVTTTGTLDSQMAILRNHVPANPSEELIYDEIKRAEELCKLASQLKIDGIIRMNAGFEILLCDHHKSGIRELFTTNITVPRKENRGEDPSLPRDHHHQPSLAYGNVIGEQNGWEWPQRNIWQYGHEPVRGISENRVRLDTCRFASWYDPSLQSLNESRRTDVRGNETYENGWGLRQGHRLLDASENDIATFRAWLSRATSSDENSKCSNKNWQAMAETIIHKYRGRAREILFNLEKNSSDAESVHHMIGNVYRLTASILSPHLEYPIVQSMANPETKNKTLARCSTLYTESIEPDTLSEFEVLIKESTYIVVTRLCQWAWDVLEWTEGRMHNRLQQTAQTSTISSQGDNHTIQQEILKYQAETHSLLEWVGWDV